MLSYITCVATDRDSGWLPSDTNVHSQDRLSPTIGYYRPFVLLWSFPV